jgi:NAD(P)-dependent dehydrogenase (short-subunit alcohol dehydrogenase family)
LSSNMATRSSRFAGKAVLVTGASRGIGRACAISFAESGADAVAVNYIASKDEADKTVESIRKLGAKSQAFKTDVSRSAEVNQLVNSVEAEFGRIDILVNNAGVLKRTPFLEITEAEWNWVMDIDLKGYFLVGQAVARRMVAQKIAGCVVNVSSIMQDRPGTNLAHYATAKAGVAMLTKSMAIELAPFGIRVNAVAPSIIETDVNKENIADPEWRKNRLERIPLGVFGKPEDVAKAVLFLASEDSKFSTGRTIFMDGGAGI